MHYMVGMVLLVALFGADLGCCEVGITRSRLRREDVPVTRGPDMGDVLDTDAR
jgi:hypothetical protein